MIYHTISAQVAPGKMREAEEWSKRLEKHFQKAFNLEMITLVPVTAGPGQAGRIVWMTTHDSLADWGEFVEKELADAERNSLVREAFVEKEIIVSHSWSRTLRRKV
jgi:hypothetical protein